MPPGVPARSPALVVLLMAELAVAGFGGELIVPAMTPAVLGEVASSRAGIALTLAVAALSSPEGITRDKCHTDCVHSGGML
jgi:hypothetical protein